MASWNDLVDQFEATPPEDRSAWIQALVDAEMASVSRQRGGRNVLFYASAFLQKPEVGRKLSISHEDMNGFMSCIYQMDCSAGLTLILHTPGGDPNAAAAIVDYLRDKFDDVEVIVPTLAMSAGTMIALASDCIVMGRQSQLGPIDPQLIGPGRPMSARAVVDQFDLARRDILDNIATAHLWAPILSQVGPALLRESQNALEYSEELVASWISKWMLADRPNADGAAIARHFNDASTHKNHGRRINLEEAKRLGVRTERLEDSPSLQNSVLTAYHVMTLIFTHSPSVKFIMSNHGKRWMQNVTIGKGP